MPDYICLLQDDTNEAILKVGRMKRLKGFTLLLEHVCEDFNTIIDVLLRDLRSKYVSRPDLADDCFEGNKYHIMHDIHMSIVNNLPREQCITNDIGKENTDYITLSEFEKILFCQNCMITKYIDFKHFNPSHVANMNVKCQNKRLFYKISGEWMPVHIDKLVSVLYHLNVREFYNKYTAYKEWQIDTYAGYNDFYYRHDYYQDFEAKRNIDLKQFHYAYLQNDRRTYNEVLHNIKNLIQWRMKL